MAVQQHLRVAARREGGMVVIELHGELDLASASLLQDEIDHPDSLAASILVLDLSGLQFVDSTGLRMILATNAAARERGQRFAVTRGTAQVRRLLDLTRAGEYLRIVDSPAEMLE